MSQTIIEGARALLSSLPEFELGDDIAILCEDGKIAWLGPSAQLPHDRVRSHHHRIDARGALVTPGLIDCHAHPVFAGDRAQEFAMRARGADYLAIAAQGGGIAATLGPTRQASHAQLVALTVDRVNAALATGTTTMEAKTGYDLTVAGELGLLSVLREAGTRTSVTLVPTLLAAHLVPPEFKNNRAEYVKQICENIIPQAAQEKLAQSVDVYCDVGAFTCEEAVQIWQAAQKHGLAIRGHVGQFSDLQAAQKLGELKALSADHVEHISTDGIAALAQNNVVAVMLPGACVQLRLPVPPISAFREANVAMALASDLNPGSCYSSSLPLQMWLATTHYAMSVEEAWAGVTTIAARALGLGDVGSIAVGKRADLVIWDAADPAEIPYRMGQTAVRRVLKNGRIVL